MRGRGSDTRKTNGGTSGCVHQRGNRNEASVRRPGTAGDRMARRSPLVCARRRLSSAPSASVLERVHRAWLELCLHGKARGVNDSPVAGFIETSSSSSHPEGDANETNSNFSM